MSKYKRPWLSPEDLMREAWELNMELFSVRETLKVYIAKNGPIVRDKVDEDLTFFFDIINELNRFANLIRRLTKELADVKVEIKEREDEENQNTAD